MPAEVSAAHYLTRDVTFAVLRYIGELDEQDPGCTFTAPGVAEALGLEQSQVRKTMTALSGYRVLRRHAARGLIIPHSLNRARLREIWVASGQALGAGE